MPKLAYKNCRRCGRPSSVVGPLSHTRQCEECGLGELERNVVGLATHSGPEFARWRRALAASVGGVLLDDVLP